MKRVAEAEREKMATNVTDTNLSTPAVTTTHDMILNIIKWTNGLIIILGFITNTLILVILARGRIGSRTTRIILMFLAATDILVMANELFIHYIPMHWQWFPVFHSDTSCAVAFWVQASAVTMSAWYITLMTVERFIAVYFPIKAKIMCTRRKVFVACILIPILSLTCFCFLLMDIISSRDNGYLHCEPREESKPGFKSKVVLWIALYFFIPAMAIVMLNVAIVVRLANAHKLQKAMTKVVGRTSINNSVKSSKFSRSKSTSSSSQSIKKATTLVITASVAFVLLMIPRGVSTTLSLDADWDYKTVPLFILDNVAYQLQYLNHSINFFLYVLANSKFRRELWRICCCSGGKYRPGNHRTQKYTDTDVTQTSQVRSGRPSQLLTAPDSELGNLGENRQLCDENMELAPLNAQT